jgi:hypothetical protein
MKRWGVAASGEGAVWMEERASRWSAPFALEGVAAALSAGRKMTLIFFSWIEALLVCSIFDHYAASAIEPTSLHCPPYQGCDIGEFLICGDENGLHEELVPAFGIWRRVLLHGLEQN